MFCPSSFNTLRCIFDLGFEFAIFDNMPRFVNSWIKKSDRRRKARFQRSTSLKNQNQTQKYCRSLHKVFGLKWKKENKISWECAFNCKKITVVTGVQAQPTYRRSRRTSPRSTPPPWTAPGSSEPSSRKSSTSRQPITPHTSSRRLLPSIALAPFLTWTEFFWPLSSCRIIYLLVRSEKRCGHCILGLLNSVDLRLES